MGREQNRPTDRLSQRRRLSSTPFRAKHYRTGRRAVLSQLTFQFEFTSEANGAVSLVLTLSTNENCKHLVIQFQDVAVRSLSLHVLKETLSFFSPEGNNIFRCISKYERLNTQSSILGKLKRYTTNNVKAFKC